MKRFNVTGMCVGSEHYMVDISRKLDEIEKLVDSKHYFTINRARQYGKTTTLFHLKKRLEGRGDYICAEISFEDVGIGSFATEEAFCRMFLGRVSEALEYSNADDEYARKWLDPDVLCIEALRKHITKMCKGVKLVLMIDEVDKSSNNMLFLHFLGVLRAKYLSRQKGVDFTFHSVILAGVTDIKNLKMKMINDGHYTPLREEGRILNSPWNIAADFDVGMSFSSDEISTMLMDYENENKTGMDITAIAEAIFDNTNGYPVLVSRICRHIDEKLGKNWTTEGVAQAVRNMLEERNVLVDGITKNLGNNRDLKNFYMSCLFWASANHLNL